MNKENYEILSYQVDFDLLEGGKNASTKSIKVRNQAIKDMKQIKNHLKNTYPSTKFSITKEIVSVDNKNNQYYSLKMDSKDALDVGTITAETITYMMVNNVGKNTLYVVPLCATTLNELITSVDKSEEITVD